MKTDLKQKEMSSKEFKLKDDIITVIPIPRGNSMIKDPNHVGYFMYPDTSASFVLPRRMNGNWAECLTLDEKEYLEKELNVDLSFSRNNNFWASRHVKINRTPELLINGIEIDISTPDGYLDYKILAAHPVFAPSWDERHNPEYRFALIKRGEKLEEEFEEASIKQNAFLKFNEIKNNKEGLLDFLIRYGKRPGKDQSLEYLRTEVWKIVDILPKEFMKVVGDSNYETKVFIDKALRSGGMIMKGRNTYCLGYGSEDVLGRTLEETILYLKDKKNQTIYLEIQARIENINNNK